MGAISDFPYRRVSPKVEKILPNTVYGYLWEQNNIEGPNRREFLGVSLHLTKEQRQLFKEDLYKSYEKVYGKRSPGIWMGTVGNLEVIASDIFHNFIRDYINGDRNGILIPSPTLVHLPRFEFLVDSNSLIEVIKKHCLDQKIELKSIQEVLEEIKYGTSLWHQHREGKDRDW